MGSKSQPSNRALYRTYRSRTFADVVGQPHISKTLAAAVERNKTVHAYLFTGPHGVGKTTVARILAHAINRLPYDPQINHLDVIEIDAASNRGIDEVRELRERAYVAPSTAKYKVYIIDEVHMLTTPAFNALLKLLEEPPEHVVFILATTEAHKVPATIRSRAQWHAFNPIAPELIQSHLADIARQEQIAIEPAVFELLASHGRGSLRDSIGLLEQLASGGQSVTMDHALEVLGLAPVNLVAELLESISDGDWQRTRALCQEARSDGVSAKQLALQLSDELTKRPPQLSTLTLTERLLTVGQASDPWLLLEVILLSESLKAGATDDSFLPKAASNTSTNAAISDKAADINRSLSPGQWQAVLDEVKTRNNSLYALLRMAEAKLENDTLQLSFGFEFHKQRLDDERNQQLVSEIASIQLQRPLKISSRVDKSIDVNKHTSDKPLLDVIQVMGGGVSVDYEEGAS